MMKQLIIGKVTEINGSDITILMDSLTNLETIQYEGKNYKGIYSGSFVGIIRGLNIIVCRVVKERLTDTEKNPKVQIYVKNRFKRELFVKIWGNIRNGKYTSGIEVFPMIFNDVILLDESILEEILQLYSESSEPSSNESSKPSPNEVIESNINKTLDKKLKLGKIIFENFPVYIGINKLFNTHIGIFGTTGSGKSNTLAQLYFSLFNSLFNRDFSPQYNKCKFNNGFPSTFIFFDFNNEYTCCFKTIAKEKIKIINLERENNNSDLNNDWTISKDDFWDIDLFIALLNPAEKKQKPLFKDLINDLKEKDKEMVLDKLESIINNKLQITQNNNQSGEKNKLYDYNELKKLKKIEKTISKNKENEKTDYKKQYDVLSDLNEIFNNNDDLKEIKEIILKFNKINESINNINLVETLKKIKEIISKPNETNNSEEKSKIVETLTKIEKTISKNKENEKTNYKKQYDVLSDLNEIFNNNDLNEILNNNNDLKEIILNLNEINKSINEGKVLKEIKKIINKFQEKHIDDNYSALLKRFLNILKSLFKFISFSKENNNSSQIPIWIFQFNKTSLEDKKIISLMIAKILYNNQKTKNAQEQTTHLIIDEAHNILSEKQINETEERKNYRLSVFEEIIKEGRKFSFFITLSSQRPSDISLTLISQLHNFFVHRLVNEYDLKAIRTSINELDEVSSKKIPSLNPGQCVLSGVAFKHPTLIQVEELKKEYKPKSENVDLLNLWFKPKCENKSSKNENECPE